MSAAPRTLGVLMHDSPFNRALCGALLSSLERQALPLSLLLVLRPRRSIGRGLARRVIGAKGSSGIQLDLPGYTRLVGEPAVRGQQEQVVRFERDHRERVLGTQDLADAATVAEVRRRGPSVLFSEGGGLLRQPFLDLFPLGVMNMHGSGPLPKYRGLGSLEFALIDRQPVTMNVHLIDSGIDTGSVLAQRTLSLTGHEKLSAIYAMLMRDSRDFIAETARAYLDGAIAPVPQDRSAGRQYFEPHPVLEAYAERRFRSPGSSNPG
jgi:folate-dependent phosphoribosylglycinamide formyltransferase PurN